MSEVKKLIDVNLLAKYDQLIKAYTSAKAATAISQALASYVSQSDLDKVTQVISAALVELAEHIANTNSALDALTGTENTTDVIDTLNEIIAFLDTYKNTDSLASILSALESAIHTWVEQKEYLTTHQDITGKQDVISDLATIRSGAALGATAIQEHQDINGKADKSALNDLSQVTSAALVELSEHIANNTQSIALKADQTTVDTLAQVISAALVELSEHTANNSQIVANIGLSDKALIFNADGTVTWISTATE